MTISERIFKILDDRGLSQKDLSDMTGIRTSVISDWKRKGTNPGSDRILKICEALDVTPEELLGGTRSSAEKRDEKEYYLVKKKSDLGIIVKEYGNMDELQRSRLRGYVDAITDIRNNPNKH